MNPYQVLGVSQTADEDTIKRHIEKRQSRDATRSVGDKRAEERFKEIGEAYRILSDKQKRKEYDAGAAQKEQKSAAGRNNAGTGRKNTGGGTIDPGDIEKEFERFFSMGKQSEKKENRTQQKINPMDVTDLFERYMGLKR
ncbi:MAG: DnaJ domain-containing protein [Roseburia intestinalis]